MGALLTPPTTLTWEDYATVMVSLEFHQLIRRVSWSALDTYLESVGVVCSCRASTGSHFTLTPACPRRSISKQWDIPTFAIRRPIRYGMPMDSQCGKTANYVNLFTLPRGCQYQVDQ